MTEYSSLNNPTKLLTFLRQEQCPVTHSELIEIIWTDFMQKHPEYNKVEFNGEDKDSPVPCGSE